MRRTIATEIWALISTKINPNPMDVHKVSESARLVKAETSIRITSFHHVSSELTISTSSYDYESDARVRK